MRNAWHSHLISTSELDMDECDDVCECEGACKRHEDSLLITVSVAVTSPITLLGDLVSSRKRRRFSESKKHSRLRGPNRNSQHRRLKANATVRQRALPRSTDPYEN